MSAAQHPVQPAYSADLSSVPAAGSPAGQAAVAAMPAATATETLQELVRARLALVRHTELAFRSGLSHQTLYNYATGKSVACKPEHVPRLAAALGIAPERLAAILKRALEARIPAPS